MHHAGEHVQLRAAVRRRRDRASDEMRPRWKSSPPWQACAPEGSVDFARLRDHAAIRAAIAAWCRDTKRSARSIAPRQSFRLPGARCTHRTSTRVRQSTRRGHHGAVARAGRCELRLMTLRSEGQFNTVVYETKTSTVATNGATW